MLGERAVALGIGVAAVQWESWNMVKISERRQGIVDVEQRMQLLTLRQIDVDEKGSLDKATVISSLQQTGDADYDSVCA